MTPHYAAAFQDLRDGCADWRMWMRLGWRDIRRRYARSIIGPFWTTLSLAILITALSLVWANLWKINVKDYLPFISAGLICWTLISTTISESCNAFVGAEPLIKSLRFPYTILTLSVVWRNLVLFMHNLVIYAFVVAYASVPVTWATFLVIPGVLLVCLSGLSVGLLLASLGARFRDVQPLTASILQIAFFVTPIFWSAEQIRGRASAILVDINVLFHYIEVIRMPMMGKAPALDSWLVVLACTFVGWFAALWFFSRFRRRISYWL